MSERKEALQEDDRCANCIFFWKARNVFADGIEACRRYPPLARSGWARTSKNLWCGEFSPIAQEPKE